MDHDTALELLACLAECASLHEAHERSRKLSRRDVDELASQVFLCLCVR